MNVAALIAELAKYPPEATVILYDYDADATFEFFRVTSTEGSTRVYIETE
jgi:hypothetical protein